MEEFGLDPANAARLRLPLETHPVRPRLERIVAVALRLELDHPRPDAPEVRMFVREEVVFGVEVRCREVAARQEPRFRPVLRSRVRARELVHEAARRAAPPLHIRLRA